MIENCEHLQAFPSDTSVDDMVKIYNENLSNICNTVSPVVIKNVRERPQQVWYTEDLQRQKQEKRRIERKFLKSRSVENKLEYKRKCDNYYSNVRLIRSNHYKNVITENRDDLKAIYGIVNKLSGDRKQLVYPTSIPENEISDKFAEYFTEKILTIRQKLSEDEILYENDEIDMSSCHLAADFVPLKKFDLVSMDELNLVYREMKKKNYRYDPVPTKVLTKCFEKVSPCILQIINKSISSRIFPSNLKHATVLPLIKDENGNAECMKNYRPLHNTPMLAKITEKCILRQLNSHITANSLHSQTQSGYKKYHSCETALLKLVNDVQLEIEQNKLSLILMLDQSAAFDTVDVPTLLIKLEKLYGIYDEALEWMASYLLDRTFTVVVNGNKSQNHSMAHGVPQGTILAPILYTLYTGDLNTMVEKIGLKIHSFADDTNIYIGFKPIDELTLTKRNLEKSMNIIKKYMAKNFLKLNIEKTQILFCGSVANVEMYGTRLDEFNQLMAGDCSRTKNGKTLGVRLDENLSFNDMISDTCSAGHFKLDKLRNMRTVLDSDLKLTLVKCYILSKIDYCNVLLNLATNKKIKRLQKLVNSSIRFIYNIRKAASITPYAKKAHILPVSYRIQYKSCLYIFKALHGIAPSYICDLVRRRPLLREGLRSSLDDTVVEPTCRGKTIAEAMCNTWNKLPVNLRHTNSLDAFKRNLKTHYFCIAYD